MHKKLSLAVALLAIGAAATLAAQIVTSGAPQGARDGGSTPQIGTGAIAGKVMTEESVSRPVRRASVSVANENQTVRRTVVTNDAGVFSIDKLPPGKYSLSATKPAFIRTAYGARRYDRPGTPITLAAGQKLDNMTLKMARGGVIAGIITDENGRPAPGTNVRVLQLRTQNGERSLNPVPSAGSPLGEATDDRGMFRVFGLPPGDYVVIAQPRLTGGADIRQMTPEEIQKTMKALQQPPAPPAQPGAPKPTPTPDPGAVTVGYAPVFFPGTTSALSASTVTLNQSEERSGINFRLQLVRTARVRGTVMMPGGAPPQGVQLVLNEVGQIAAPGISMNNLVVSGQDGKFMFNGITPGQYTISARSGGGGGRGMAMSRGGGDFVMAMPPPNAGGGGGANVNAGPPQQLWGQLDLSINGQDQNEIVISMQPGMTITGRLNFEGVTTPPTDFSRVNISLMPPASNAGPVMITMGPTGAVVSPNGEFKISGVTPGKYGRRASIFVQGALAEWTAKSIIVKSRDALDAPFEVQPNENISNAMVTFTDQLQRVSGALKDGSGRPAPDYTIVVFPADKAMWTGPSRRIKTTRPATDGQYSIIGLPAGDYRLAAVTDMAPADANDAWFLEQLAASSYAFTLKDGEKKVQDLKIGG